MYFFIVYMKRALHQKKVYSRTQLDLLEQAQNIDDGDFSQLKDAFIKEFALSNISKLGPESHPLKSKSAT